MQKTNKSRRFTGGGRSDRKKQKQEEATGENGRNTLYAKLTIQQKIDRLPPLPLCAKQHAKLQALLDGTKKSSITKEVAMQMAEDSHNQEGDAVASRPTGNPISKEVVL